jgi:hypothetical protein
MKGMGCRLELYPLAVFGVSSVQLADTSRVYMATSSSKYFEVRIWDIRSGPEFPRNPHFHV